MWHDDVDMLTSGTRNKCKTRRLRDGGRRKGGGGGGGRDLDTIKEEVHEAMLLVTEELSCGTNELRVSSSSSKKCYPPHLYHRNLHALY